MAMRNLLAINPPIPGWRSGSPDEPDQGQHEYRRDDEPQRLDPVRRWLKGVQKVGPEIVIVHAAPRFRLLGVFLSENRLPLFGNTPVT